MCGFSWLLCMCSGNCEGRFWFLCYQNVSILIICQIGFYCEFQLVMFHFLTVFGFRFFDSIFSVLNGDSLLRGISSVDPITMKDGKLFGFSSVSQSELSQNLFFFFFISLGFICISHMNNYEFHQTCSPPTSEPYVGDVPRGKPIRLGNIRATCSVPQHDWPYSHRPHSDLCKT